MNRENEGEALLKNPNTDPASKVIVVQLYSNPILVKNQTPYNVWKLEN
jgi:hypothetical protein